MDDPQLIHFHRQYLQQVQNLVYPPAQLLVTHDVQAQIYKHFFEGPLKGPPGYQRRVLKKLIDLIERAIPEGNTDEYEVSNELMEHIAYLSTLPQEDPITSASQTQILSYTPPVSFESTPPRILIEEAPNLLAAGSNVGLRTWEAALHLATYLHANPDLVRGRAIIELGAGTGLVSILAAGVLDARYVLSTDGLPHVVDSIEKNIDRNVNLWGIDQKIDARLLDWGDSATEDLSEVLEVDVLETGGAGGEMPEYDLVVGADITYNPEVVPVLAELLSVLLHDMYAHTNMQAIISATVRNEKTLSVFREACRERKLQVAEIEFTCPSVREQKGFFHEQAFPIIIMKITKQ